MEWVLLIYLFYQNHGGPTTIQYFKTKASCESAIEEIKKAKLGWLDSYSVCIPVDSKK